MSASRSIGFIALLGTFAIASIASLGLAACGEDSTSDGGESNANTANNSGGDGDGDGDEGPQCADFTPELTCGGTQCSELGEDAAMICAFSCCTEDGKCGALLAGADDSPGECRAQAQPDTRCAGFEGLLGPIEGCCTDDNECGGITFGRCTSRSDLNRFSQDEGQPTIDCDGNPLPEDDEQSDAGI